MPQASDRPNFGKAGAAAAAVAASPEGPSSLSEREENLRLGGEILVCVGLLVLLVALFLWQQLEPGLAYDGYIDLPREVIGFDPRLADMVSNVSFSDRYGEPLGLGLYGTVLLFIAFGALARRRWLMKIILLVISLLPYGLFGLYVPDVQAAGWLIVIWSAVAAFRQKRKWQGALWLLLLIIGWNVADLPALAPERFPPRHDAIAFTDMVPPPESPMARPLKPLPDNVLPTFSPAGTRPDANAETAKGPEHPPFDSFRALDRPDSSALAYVLVQEGYYRRDMGMMEAHLKQAWAGRDPADPVAGPRLITAALRLAKAGLDDGGLAGPVQKRLDIIQVIALPVTILALALLAFGYALQILAGLITARLERMKGLGTATGRRPEPAGPKPAAAAQAADHGVSGPIRQLHQKARSMARLALLLAGIALLLASGGWFFEPGASAAWPAFDRLHLLPSVLGIVPDAADVLATTEFASPGINLLSLIFWLAVTGVFLWLLAVRRYRPALAILLGFICLNAFVLMIPVKQGAIEIPFADLQASTRTGLAARQKAGLPVHGDLEGEAYAYLSAQIAYLEKDPARTWASLKELEGTSYQENASVAWRLAAMREWLVESGVREAATMKTDFSFDRRRMMAWWLVAAALLLAGLALLPTLLWYLLFRRFRRLSALLESLAGSGLARRQARYGGGDPQAA